MERVQELEQEVRSTEAQASKFAKEIGRLEQQLERSLIEGKTGEQWLRLAQKLEGENETLQARVGEIEETIERLKWVLAEAIADNTRLELDLARLRESE